MSEYEKGLLVCYLQGENALVPDRTVGTIEKSDRKGNLLVRFENGIQTKVNVKRDCIALCQRRNNRVYLM